ncbi:MAG: 50S ribosomal protein L21 [Flavobacteriaceae bacterium]|nr:MAG: 50S ribosomal protein L21 [Flavobacteriaceae bacterium]
MYAIVEIAGLQYKVEQDQFVYVNRLDAQEGDKITLDRVLLIDNNGTVTIGAPAIDGKTIQAQVVKHLKGEKVIVFKKKRRKGYQKKNGHRQSLTQLLIESIAGVAGTGKKPAAKAAPAKAEKTSEAKASKAASKDESEKAAPAKKSASKTAGDDLTKIEGIGPKVKELFNESGIVTFSDLAAKSSDELKAILEPKGGRYAAMDPSTWPKQAEMAADGNWDELKKWQDELNAGV